MVADPLVSWMISEKAKGRTDAQLREYMLRQGYPPADVDDALASSNVVGRESFAASILHLPWYVLGGFILFFAFLAYASGISLFGVPGDGLILLLVLGLGSALSSSLRAKGKRGLALWAWIAVCVILVALTSIVHALLLWVLLFLVAHHALFYHIRSRCAYPGESVFFASLIALTFAVVCAYGLMALYAVLIPYGSLHTVLFVLVISTLISLLLVSYHCFFVLLIRRMVGSFDHAAYFRFKRFPFTLLHVFSWEEKGDARTFKRLSWTVPIAMFLLCLVVTCIVGVNFTLNAYARANTSMDRARENVGAGGPAWADGSEDTPFNFSPALQSTRMGGLSAGQWISIRDDIHSARLIAPRGWFGALGFFYSGKVVDDVSWAVLHIARLGLELVDARFVSATIRREFSWSEGNRVNNTRFYDGTATLDAHADRLQQTVDDFYLRWKAQPASPSPDPSMLRVGFLFEDDPAAPLIHQTLYALQQKWVWTKGMDKLGSDIQQTRTEPPRREIEEGYLAVKNDASPIDRMLALKVLENRLLRELQQSCPGHVNGDCAYALVMQTKDILHCLSLYDKFRNRCIQELVAEDTTRCAQLDPKLQELCSTS